MLALTPDQTQALVAIKRGRDLRALADQLSAAFPEVAGRAGERLPALIEHGVQRGAAWGLSHAVCLARYLACWFMFGAEFETRPEFAWARDILSPQRLEGAKVFQLCRRGREMLARPQPGQLPAAEFDAALRQLDEALMPRGHVGSLLPAERIKLGDPCDIDALDLRAAGAAPQPYRLEQGQWRRVPLSLPDGLTLSGGATLPPQLHLLSRSLRLRSRADHVCDEATHPLIQYACEHGLQEWRGRHATEFTLHLQPLPALEGLAVEGSAALSLLTAAGCGLRESGAAFGEQQTQLAAYAPEQQLLAWRREPGMAARTRLERDGSPLESARWTQGLDDIERQLSEGLARLATAWERESGVTGASMQANPQVFAGTGALSWGWAQGESLSTAPHFRVAGMLELVACELQLRLGGRLELAGSQSRLALHCSSSEKLSVSFDRSSAALDVATTIACAQTAFRQPFVLHLEAIANAERPALLDQVGPVTGAIVGACGLRLRADGPGLEWFCEIGVEAASVRLMINDPLLGPQLLNRPLLPAMKLVSWRMH
ncbi:MAG: hypothetical protein JO006_15525 [Paucibacter sp.]|nr:hypothetical protein [Roseateles sp.]